MSGLERRFAALEVRDSGAVVEGVAMPYGSTARIFDAFDERVEAGAFSGLDDVTLNRMHVQADIIARTGGGGLVLDDSAARLHLRADVPSVPRRRERPDCPAHPSRAVGRDARHRRGLARARSTHHPRRRAARDRDRRPSGLQRHHACTREARAGWRHRGAMVARRRVSALRRWAEKNVVVADGPRAGKRWKAGGAPWAEVLDAMDDPDLEQVTVRGSVQSGKTATLLVAALGHFAAGRSVLFYEPDEALKRAMSGRIRAWARACRDVTVSEAWERPRPPHSPHQRRRRAPRGPERRTAHRDPHADRRDRHSRRTARVQPRHRARAGGPDGGLRRARAPHHRVECRRRRCLSHHHGA